MIVRTMNREAMPLIIGILFPILLVAFIALYISGYDITLFFRKINIIYYLMVIPFGLGMLVVIFWFRKPRD